MDQNQVLKVLSKDLELLHLHQFLLVWMLIFFKWSNNRYQKALNTHNWKTKFQVHYPVEAIQNIEFSESKAQLLEAQVSRFCLTNNFMELSNKSQAWCVSMCSDKLISVCRKLN